MSKQFDDFLKQNAAPAPRAPSSEWSNILARIENDKSVWDLLKDAFSSKHFWGTAMASSLVAFMVVFKLSTFTYETNGVDEVLTESSNLYSDLALTDSDFLGE